MTTSVSSLSTSSSDAHLSSVSQGPSSPTSARTPRPRPRRHLSAYDARSPLFGTGTQRAVDAPSSASSSVGSSAIYVDGARKATTAATNAADSSDDASAVTARDKHALSSRGVQTFPPLRIDIPGPPPPPHPPHQHQHVWGSMTSFWGPSMSPYPLPAGSNIRRTPSTPSLSTSIIPFPHASQPSSSSSSLYQAPLPVSVPPPRLTPIISPDARPPAAETNVDEPRTETPYMHPRASASDYVGGQDPSSKPAGHSWRNPQAPHVDQQSPYVYRQEEGPDTSGHMGDDMYRSGPPSPTTLTDVLLEIHETLYGGAAARTKEEIEEMLSRFYEQDAVFENPLLTALGRDKIADQFVLAFSLPADAFSVLTDISCSEFTFDGFRSGIIDHTLYISFVPSLHDQGFSPHMSAGGHTPMSSYSTAAPNNPLLKAASYLDASIKPGEPSGPAHGKGTFGSSTWFSHLPFRSRWLANSRESLISAVGPPESPSGYFSFGERSAGPNTLTALLWPLLHPRSMLRELTTIRIRLLSRLEFNERGKVTRHEDTWGIREIIEGMVPFGATVYSINRRIAGVLTSWAATSGLSLANRILRRSQSTRDLGSRPAYIPTHLPSASAPAPAGFTTPHRATSPLLSPACPVSRSPARSRSQTMAFSNEQYYSLSTKAAGGSKAASPLYSRFKGGLSWPGSGIGAPGGGSGSGGGVGAGNVGQGTHQQQLSSHAAAGPGPGAVSINALGLDPSYMVHPFYDAPSSSALAAAGSRDGDPPGQAPLDQDEEVDVDSQDGEGIIVGTHVA